MERETGNPPEVQVARAVVFAGTFQDGEGWSRRAVWRRRGRAES